VVSGTGKIRPEVEVKISANVSARITKLHAEEGDRVKKGQVLVELDRTRYEAALAQAEAGYRSAQANVRLAKANMDKAQAELQRMQELYEKNLASPRDLETARTNYAVAKAQYEAAQDQAEQGKALVEQARDDLSKTTIVSPMDGVVTKVNKEEGEIALGSMFQEDVIMVVGDLSKMEVVAEVDENDVVLVSLGDKAKIEVDAIPDTSFNGHVSEIAHSAITRGLGTQEEVTNFEVKVAIDDKVSKLRPGMSATVDIQTDTSHAVLNIPIQAVTARNLEEEKARQANNEKKKKGQAEVANDNLTDEGSEKKDARTRLGTGKKKDELTEVVFVVENGVAKMVPVKTGISDETHIAIVSGLKEGQEIVIGSYKVLSKELHDGSRVKVNNRGKKILSKKEREEK